jgi:glucose/arabinose dehydrogenase
MRSRLAALVLLAAVATAAAILGVAGASTRDGAAAPQLGPTFIDGALDAHAGYVTSLAFGPDGRLYIGTLDGIRALTLDSTGTQIVSNEVIASDLRFVLGLAFDPMESGLALYASNLGRVSKFTAPDWTREDIITGLPTSPFLELTNALAFGADGTLLIAEGGLHGRSPTPLAGAILAADVHAPGFDGAVKYSSPGPDPNEIDQLSGDVRVFASGFKNPYGMIVHSNGRVYATDNGWSGLDELNLIEEGGYYGEPNENRARSDPRQATFHPGDEASNDEYTAPILYSVQDDACRLCEGIAEYTSNAFGGVMQGDLVSAALGGSIWWLKLSSDGTAINDATVIATLTDAITLTVGPAGIIYVGGSGGLYYLQPNGLGPPTPTLVPTATSTISETFVPGPTDTFTPVPMTPLPTPTPLTTDDANCDGYTDSRDAALALQFSAGLLSELPCRDRVDVDRNGRIDSVDVLLILQCSAGLRSCR